MDDAVSSNGSVNQTIVVSNVTGILKATDAAGNVRILKAGDTIYPGEVLSVANGNASFLSLDGQEFSLLAGQSFAVPDYTDQQHSGIGATAIGEGEASSNEQVAGGQTGVESNTGLGTPTFRGDNIGLDGNYLSSPVGSDTSSFVASQPQPFSFRGFSGATSAGVEQSDEQSPAPLLEEAAPQLFIQEEPEPTLLSPEVTAAAVAPEPQVSEPQAPEPQAPEPQVPEPQVPEPQAPEPQAPEPTPLAPISYALGVLPDVTASDDTATVNYHVRLNQQTGVLVNDIGSDVAVTQVNGTVISASGASTVLGQYGTLEIQADGTYNYITDNFDLTSDLVASWQFNEATGSRAFSDSAASDQIANNGTLTGDATIVSGGVTGNALRLNVSDVHNPFAGINDSFSNAALLGRYEMDGLDSGTNQVANSVGNNNGSASGGSFNVVTGSSPQGTSHIELNGSNTININTGLSAEATDVTIAFWFRWDGAENRMIASFGQYNIWINDGAIGFNTWAYDNHGISLDDLELAPGSSGLANEWHYVTATFHDGNPTQSTLRIDGIDQSLTNIPGNGYHASNADIHQTLNFGGTNGWHNIRGGVDDLQVFEGTLSNTEATRLYEAARLGSVEAGRAEVGESSEINVPDDGVVEARTITLSFQPDSDNSLVNRQILYEEGDGTSGFIVYIQNNTLYAGAYSNDSGWSGAFLNTSISSLDTSEFHRVTLSLDSSAGSMTAWLDGTQIGQVSNAQSVSGHSGDVSIGASSGEDSASMFHDGSHAGGFTYSGLIDDVRVYDRALTNLEVQVLTDETGDFTESFTYTITDSYESTTTADLDINIQRPQENLAPDANNDVLNVGAGQAVSVNSLVSAGLLGNDSDAEGDSLALTHVGSTDVASSGATSIAGQYGTLLVAADGTYSYVPSNSALGGGVDTFSYTISDGNSTAQATLTVNVLADSFASNDSVSITEQAVPDDVSYLISSSGELSLFDPVSQEVVPLGNVTGITGGSGGIGVAMLDGTLYGIGTSGLYTIDPVSLQTSYVADHTLPFDPSGFGGGPNGMLYATSFDGNIHSIHPTTGATTALTNTPGSGPSYYYDLVELDGSLFTVGYTFNEWFVHRVDIDGDGNVTIVPLTQTALTDNPSPLLVQDGQLYGFNGINELVAIDKTNGTVSSVSNVSELSFPNDTADYLSHSTLEGNVLTNDIGAQSVTSILDINGNAVTVTSGGVDVETAHGVLNIRSNGSYTYTLNNQAEQVDNLAQGETANDRFVYTTTSGSATAQAVLTVNINGADELVTVENTIEGSSQNNILTGTIENDSITGGSGDDTLTGGRGIDFFVWEDGDQGTSSTPAVDTVTDFAVGTQGDVLDLADLLPDGASGNLDQYLSFTTTDGSTTIGVSTTAGGPVVQNIVLQDVDLAANYGTTDTTALINNLTNDGNLMS
ncbi:LamG-like jellyroll fold domain-containing protein [Parendozoicomonas sp. Alg238-R29]|uniref:VCBS domain-containing protein n=1 Tax=Parendozoicomonas sp. Alg238-R29 TaxID=2993446 RepID=UPI00248E8664|nr:LamG-like jellyroll fold domain-containing protein [Parendozoicomonas sp. Alg238-R29]